MKRIFISASLCLAFAPGAQAMDPATWAAVAPSIKAAVECRAKPDTGTAAWKSLPQHKLGGIAPIKPPTKFLVFGLPVREVQISIDPEGVDGDSYTAQLVGNDRTIKAAAKLDRKGFRKTRMGTLDLDGMKQVTCTVLGEYREADFQEGA